MKKITFFYAILWSCGLFAQNWTPFPYDQKSWFEFENDDHYSQSVYYADSLIENGDTNNYYFHVKYLADWVNQESNCLNEYVYNNPPTWLDYFDSRTDSFISINTPLQEINGLYYQDSALVFAPTLELGESLTIYPTNFDEIQITCIEKTTESIFGITDSVKVFSLQAFNNDVAVNSEYDNYEYRLSKNYGFITFLPFIELLDSPKTTVNLQGFEDDNQTLQGEKAWTIIDFTPYEAGDVIYYEIENIQHAYYEYCLSYGIDSITSRTLINDTLKYTYHRLSPSGGAISPEYTKTINPNQLNYTLFDKGIYNFDIANQNYCYSWGGYNDLNIMHLNSYKNDFSFTEGEDSYNFSFGCGSEMITANCLHFYPVSSANYTYNTDLGQTSYNTYSEGGYEDQWRLLIYRKGEQEYNTLFHTLEDSYSCTTDSVYLGNPYSMTYSGVGVQENYFHPSLVPESLHNIPLIISYTRYSYCNSSSEPLVLYKTVTVNCPATIGDCALSNFTAVPSVCNGDGEIYIDISFDFQNVGTEGFEIMINGTEYGTYSYQTFYEDNKNITIGPFTADGTTDWAVYIIDKENGSNCSTNTININAVDCTDAICQFSNLTATTTCNNRGRFQVDLSFDYQGVVGNSFWANGNTFNYSELDQNGFVTLNNIFFGNGTNYTIIVRDSIATNCKDSIMVSVDCLDELCGIQNVDIEPITDDVCQNGGEYYIDFDHDPNSTYDLIWINSTDTFYREFGIQPPFQVNIDSISSGTWETEVLIVDSNNPCCKSLIRYFLNDNYDNCYNSLNHYNFVGFNVNNFYIDYEIEKINNGAEFLIHLNPYWINIQPALLYGYTVLVNDAVVGEYRMPEDSLITVGPFPADSTTDYVLEIATLCPNPDELSEIVNIGLVGPNDCVFVNPSITTGPCNSDDKFWFYISFDYGGDVEDDFAIDINGNYHCDYSYHSLDYNDFVVVGSFTGDNTTAYTFDVYDLSNECSFTITATAKDCFSSELSLKVFLEGAYNPTTQTMRTTLAEQNLLPLSQPYNVPPWNYNGTETITNMPLDVVDWVLVEMRTGTPSETGTPTTDLVETKAGLLLSNGQVVDTNNEPLNFENLNHGTHYQIVVRHRNHLDVISTWSVKALNGMTYDFTTGANYAYGPSQQKTNSDGTAALFVGDYTTDGIIQNSDSDAWLSNPAALYTYDPIDGNLDGIIQITDYDAWYPNRSKIGVVEIRY